METAEKFRDHINDLLSRTITQQPVVAVQAQLGVLLTFRNPEQRPTQVELDTRVGRMGFYFGQLCISDVDADGTHHLHTAEYKYLLTPAGSTTATLRWEYKRVVPPGSFWCRHHLQGPVTIRFNQQDNMLDNLHLPTGYVPFEEIIRFLINDLKVEPVSRRKWDGVLRESYERFRREFGS
jgi:hypothetical protein